MSEFMFKNLSVKLFPVQGELADEDCECCSYVCQGDSRLACRGESLDLCGDCTGITCGNTGVPCGNCTGITCGNTGVPCGNCTDITCGNCTNCSVPTCGDCSTAPCSANPCTRSDSMDLGCVQQTRIPIVVKADRGVSDVRAELATLKEHLRRSLADVEAREERLAVDAKPRSLDEIDVLKSHLMDAVAELDEQRAAMEGGTPAPE